MNRKKLLFSTGIANTFEWYDYALYGILAPVIGAKFFPVNEQKANLLQVFFVFAIGYLMRPLGGIFFGVMGDKFGRKVALSLAIICMAFPTALIGLIPTYESIGFTATILMIITRMIQGLSMGGVLTGSVAFSIEHSPVNIRGLIGSISMASICFGILLGSSIVSLIKLNMTFEQFDNWGWRLPFIIGIVIIFAGIYIRNHTNETLLFKNAKDDGKILNSPLKIAFTQYWFDMIISIAINATGSLMFYFQAIYLPTYLKLSRNFIENDINILVNASYLFMVFITIFSGWLSDKIGRIKIYYLNLILTIILSPILIYIFQWEGFYLVVIAQILLSFLAASYIGPEPALQAEFYPTNIRNTALSISYNTATSLFGGTAPLILEYLSQKPGGLQNNIYYILVCAFISLISLRFYRNRSVLNN